MLSGLKSPLERFASRLALRSQIDPKAREAILALPLQAVEVKAGRRLSEVGDTINSVCLIADGLLGSCVQTRAGARQINALHIEGDMADLASLVLPEAACGLEAITNSIVIRIPHSQLNALTEAHPTLGIAFWRDTATDARILAQWLSNIGRKHAQSRLAHFFCEMAHRYEQTGRFDGLGFALPMTQEHLADAMAMTSVHLNRTLMAMRAARMVEMRHKMVSILDWDGLLRLAEFDSAYLGMPKSAVH